MMSGDIEVYVDDIQLPTTNAGRFLLHHLFSLVLVMDLQVLHNNLLFPVLH